jgi:MoaA/NifB/PqqE/SkfB family radical SAM enzyme
MQEPKPSIDLNTNKVFCTFPWTHIHVTPRGRVFPCCNTGYTDYIGDYNNERLIDLMNMEDMKQLRLNMINNVPTKICNSCYEQEKIAGHSGRTHSINLFEKDIPEFLDSTEQDGSLRDFKMKYFDIRFSNICNMKCRTCSPEFSSQWSQEYHNENKSWPIVFHANKNQSTLLNEVLAQIEHTDTFYFAGGEPLITDEHYVLLETLISKNLTDVRLTYNSNLSTLRYKGKDVLDLWKHFKFISMVASIDHVQERAEYIRNGTDWGVVESNMMQLSKMPNIYFAVNTVLSVFNYTTLDKFYGYLMDKGLYNQSCRTWNLYNAFNPPYYMAQILPKQMKDSVRPKLDKFLHYMRLTSYSDLSLKMITNAINFVEAEDKWESQRETFIEKVSETDKVRGESFITTFPELAEMIY